ncbi:MAG: urea transporter [Bacteroidia bacterium]
MILQAGRRSILNSEILEGTLLSYAQLFFSQRKVLAFLLLLVTFVDGYAGLSGLIAVLVTQLTSNILGLAKEGIRTGMYAFNSLSVGLCLGTYYQFNAAYVAVLICGSLLSLLFTVWFYGNFYQRGLPFLSFPFIMSVWLILLAARSYASLLLSERGIYNYNDLYGFGGQDFVNVIMNIETTRLPGVLDVYFKSLGAIFFQYSLIVGIITSVALLLYSRIAFVLSLLGFYTGYLFYSAVGGNITELTYSYIGFNFILSAIAIGGFFLIPSSYSFLLVLIMTPLIAVLNSALAVALSVVQLPLYSMPFNLMVLMLLYLLRSRTFPKKLHLTGIQHFSPEENLYTFSAGLERFKHSTYLLMQLPFFGKWKVSQGYDGEHTHKNEWRHAFDFMIEDESGNTFQNSGLELKDYYSWQKPVVAPADGLVVDLHNHVDENAPGQVNLENNWGNSIVLKHGEHLYTQLSHLYANSFKVSLGDYVRKGDVLATLGNTGRSPYPHIHFQVQATPYVGSATIAWPVSYYLKHETTGRKTLVSFGTPSENEIVSNVETSELLKHAFTFTPGQILKWKVFSNGKESEVKWIAGVNAYNQSYLYCEKTKSYAYLLNNGTMFYFLSFKGDRNSLLYHFHMAVYQVLLGYYPDLIVRDQLPASILPMSLLRVAQDFIAPFARLLRINFELEYSGVDNQFSPKMILIRSHVKSSFWGIGQKRNSYETEILTNGISRFEFKTGNKKVRAFLHHDGADTLELLNNQKNQSYEIA